MSNRWDPNQAQHFVRPDLGPNCLQRLSVDVVSIADRDNITFKKNLFSGQLSYYTIPRQADK